MLPVRDLDHVIEHSAGVWDSLAGQRIFITGGTGFVGTWLCESLLHADRGINAVILTRHPEQFAFANSALQPLQGDVCTFDFPDGEFPYVIHAATPASTDDLDQAATRRVLEFARTHGTKRLLFTSSGAAYGRQPSAMTHIPEDYPGVPDTPYGQAKRAAESEFGDEAVIARLFAFSGPCLPLDKNFAVGNFVGDVLAGRPIRIQGDGTPYRAYLYSADLAAWLWTLLVRGQPGRAYNVGSGHSVSIAELANTVAQLTVPPTSVEIAQQSSPGAPAVRYVPSVERAERELGLRAVIPLEEGVRRMYEYARHTR
jgi:dTDP-glucose 4,6-dehydratase